MPQVLDRHLAVAPDSLPLRDMLEEHAPDYDAARRLAARVLLQLPRLADENGFLDTEEAAREIQRIADLDVAAPAWLEEPDRVPDSPLELDLVELDTERARLLHRHFHYLRSYRPGLHLAGSIDGHVAALLTFSDLDLDPIRAMLPASAGTASARVLSRVYTAAWAPRNSLSRLLALAARELRVRDPGLGLLFTYLNPGIGFDGASYKAANWQLFGRELGTRYAYLDADYVTDRELTRRFGSSDAATLERMLGGRIGFSRMPLPPLDLYAFALDSRLNADLGSTHGLRTWRRPWR